MEIKFRRKGEVVLTTMADSDLPEALVNADLRGVDLTRFTVIAVSGKKGNTRARAEALSREVPKAIILYSFSWSNGFGSGCFLPSNFDPKKLSFYETAQQLAEKAEKAEKAKSRELNEKLAPLLETRFPDVGFNVYGTGIMAFPRNTPSCHAHDWIINGLVIWRLVDFSLEKGLEEAVQILQRRQQLWNVASEAVEKFFPEADSMEVSVYSGNFNMTLKGADKSTIGSLKIDQSTFEVTSVYDWRPGKGGRRLL